MTASVVSNILADETAFSIATLSTLTGSIIHSFIRLTYFQVLLLKP